MSEPFDPARSRVAGAGAPHLFKSRLTQKTLRLFGIAVIAPLLVFAVVSLRELGTRLEGQARASVRGACNVVGATTAERLHLLRADLGMLDRFRLKQLSFEGESQAGPNAQTGQRFDWIAIATAKGVMLETSQSGVSMPSWSAAEQQHLIESGALLTFTEGEASGRVDGMLAVVPSSGRDQGRIVFGKIRPDYLWGSEWLEQSPSELVALTGDGRLIFATSASSALGREMQRAVTAEPSGGEFDWDDGDASHITSYQTIPVQSALFNDFTVGVSQPRSSILEPHANLRQRLMQFGLLIFCAVVGACLLQSRRGLSAVALLEGGMRRLAANSSEEAVVVRSTDEFGDLAEVFNETAATIRQRTRELERANQAKADFLAHMSHELRTPLSAIVGYAQISSESGITQAELEQNLKVICESGRHVTELVDTILDMSRVAAGELDVEIAPCRPAEILAAAIELVDVLATKKGLRLVVDYDPRVPATIQSDATRLRQVIINVVGNAIKFTDRGEVHVRTVWESTERDADHQLSIRVRDTGPGIAAGKIDDIFEPFHQGDLSMSRRHGGTGLGLSLSRALARRLGGDLTCRSEPGVGSEFTITIDPGDHAALTETTGLVSEPAVEQSDAFAPPLPGRSRWRILVAEDVVVNRKMAVRMLERASHEVDEAENGRIAYHRVLAAAESGRPYDAVLMDMQMPVMDGYEATERLRAKGYTGLIIALTAHALVEDRIRCLEAGCDDYAQKPFNQDLLVTVIGRNVDQIVTGAATAPS